MLRAHARSGCAAAVAWALLVGANSATAQTLDLAPPADWSGPYATFTFGAVQSDGEADLEDVDGVLLPPDVELGVLPRSIDGHETSGAIGFALGTNFQRGNIVNGIEAGINFLNLDVNFNVSNDGPFPPTGPAFATVETQTSYRTEIENLAALRWRGGVASGPNLLYVSAGVAGGQVRNEYGFGVPNLPAPLPRPYSAPTASEDGWRWGYIVGVGFERRVSETISVRAEIAHFDLADTTITGRDSFTPGFTQESIEYEFANRGTMATIGISFSF